MYSKKSSSSAARRIATSAAFALLLIILSAGQQAHACRFAPDKRPLRERIAEAPLAFIGVVRTVSESTVTFDVEHTIHGAATAGKPLSIPLSIPGSSCSIRFWPGDRWLFAGDTVPSPSSHLGKADAASSADTIGLLRREQDAPASLPAQWQACQRDNECRPLPYGCSITAVNEAYLADSRKHAWAKTGNPATVNCLSSGQPNLIEAPLCVLQRCGAWSVSPQRMP